MRGALAWPRARAEKPFTVAIAGAQGRLGRELVVQSLRRDWNVLGIVRRPDEPVLYPQRKGWLDERSEASEASAPIASHRLSLARNASLPTDVDAVIMCMSGTPFASRYEMRRQTEVVRRLCRTCPPHARVCFVSAHGAGDSLGGSGPAIRFMHSVYLKETYLAKEEQEEIVRDAFGEDALVIRPRVLSVEPVPLNSLSTPRSELAKRILTWCEEACAPP